MVKVETPQQNLPVKVLAFDVFGTVVDWHGSIARHVDSLGLHTAAGDRVDGNRFALAWRAGYKPAMARVRSGELGWTRIDDLHRMILDRVLVELDVDPTRTDEAFRRSLNLIWHRLEAWPDAPGGLTRLKRGFTITTLSNGNIGLLTDMAKYAGLPWDCILSAEVFRHYKPDPETYLGVCDLFAIAPAEMVMVAAHKNDLRAAKACGCRTAYVERPLEFGASPPEALRKDLSREADFDWHAKDFNDLADQLLPD